MVEIEGRECQREEIGLEEAGMRKKHGAVEVDIILEAILSLDFLVHTSTMRLVKMRLAICTRRELEYQ